MWLHQNKVIEKLEDFPNETYGFIYITTHIPTGKKYLGKKFFDVSPDYFVKD